MTGQDRNEGLDLVGQLVMASYRSYSATSQSLIESLQRQLNERDAELAVIREQVTEMLAGPYAPSASAIERAVFLPSGARVAAFIADRAAVEE